MDTSVQDASGYFVWELPGKPVAIHLCIDVIDRLGPEVMRGFGAVPKRGAEVGGVLLGTIEHGDQTIVRVEDFEPVECEYRRGPSYLFGGDDAVAFHDACLRWEPDSSRSPYAVGYFRSHTREGLALAGEDIALLDQYFSSPAHVALLIKPFATKVSIASFFFREDGIFQSEAPLEFPFRRRELTGEEAPPRRPMTERIPRYREPRGELRSFVPAAVAEEEEVTESPALDISPGHAYAVTTPAKSRLRSGWVWVPLSFIFLLFGVLLGLLIALSMGQKVVANAPSDLSLGLSVTKSGGNLNVKWNGQSLAIRAASGGNLEIEEGGRMRPVQLDPAQLQNGTITYTNSSNTVHFRLKVYLSDGVMVMQGVDWKQ